jgi:hypothetical protein
MTWMLDLTETMSGWLTLDGGPREDLYLRLSASAPLSSRPTAPRPFAGTVLVGPARESLPTEGTLTLLPSGPEYKFGFTSARWGSLRCAGRKTYRLRGLRASLVTCPLRVYRGQNCVGDGEIQYREPLWRFALSSLRLRRATNTNAAAIARTRPG